MKYFENSKLNEIAVSFEEDITRAKEHLNSISRDIKQLKEFLNNSPIRTKIILNTQKGDLILKEKDIYWCINEEEVRLIETKAEIRIYAHSYLREFMIKCLESLKSKE